LFVYFGWILCHQGIVFCVDNHCVVVSFTYRLSW
jgi:hypothetical protein